MEKRKVDIYYDAYQQRTFVHFHERWYASVYICKYMRVAVACLCLFVCVLEPSVSRIYFIFLNHNSRFLLPLVLVAAVFR